MELNDLLKDALLSGDTVNTVSRKAGTSKKETESVINAALPALLGSLNGAANKPSGNAGALLSSVQEEKDEQVQGTNILAALLGQGGAGNLATSVSGSTGVGTNASNAILVALAPIILKALAANIFGTSQSAKPTQSKPQQSAGDSLLGALLGAALGGTTQSAKPTQQAKPQQSGTDQLLGALLGAALGGNTKAAPQKKEGATESAKKTATGAKKTTSAKAGAGTAGKDTQGAKKVIKKVE